MFSLLSSAISTVSGASWQYYVIGGLVISLSASAWYNKHQIDEYATLNASYASVAKSLKDSKNSLKLKDSSCKIDDNSVVELDAEKKVIVSKADSIDQEFIKLKQQAIIAKQAVAKAANIPPTKENIKEVVKDETNVLPDDGLLSDNIKRLLHTSYCNAEPTADSCNIPTR